MSSHVWVRITFLPLEVELVEVVGGDETFHYTYSTEDKARAEEESAYGCFLCDEPLTAETYHKACTGVPDDLSEAFSADLYGRATDGDGPIES